VSAGSRATAAIVRAARVPVRAESDHRSEMVSEWVCGEVLDTGERRADWVRTRGPDGYEGWVHGGGLLQVDGATAEEWRAGAQLYSLGIRLDGPDASPDAGALWPTPAFLPWGARARPAGDAVRLPDGHEVRPSEPGRLVNDAGRRRRFPPEPSGLVATASAWCGTPYVWGGRTRAGADCSGFVQAVFAAHGVALPRDSREQLAVGPVIDAAHPDPGERRAGDLLFFGGSGTEITHVALCLGGTRILHSAAANGAVAADDLDDPPAALADLPERLRGVTRPLG